MLWEGLTLLLIENGVVRKDDAVNVISGVIEIIQNNTGTHTVSEAKKELFGLLETISRSLSAANSSPLLPNGCDGRGSCLFVD